MNIYAKYLFGLTAAFFSASALSATLVIENGNLKGADNIVFDGYTASVRFVEGTCASLFGGCDDGNDIIFDSLTDTQDDAYNLGVAANFALQEQVFAANPLYDSNPILTYGCDAGAIQWCGIITPVHVRGTGTVATVNYQNQPDNLVDSIGISGVDVNGFDSGDWYYLTYASWTLVPVPASVWLFGSGLIGLIGIARRKKS
jgi:hypothetical protein